MKRELARKIFGTKAHKKNSYCLQEKIHNLLKINYLASQEKFLINNGNNLLFLYKLLKTNDLYIYKQSKQ